MKNQKIYSAILLAFSLTTLGFAFFQIKKNTELSTNVSQLQKDKESLETKRQLLATEIETLKKKNNNELDSCKQERDSYKEQIEAFAKQAASCERVKQQLRK